MSDHSISFVPSSPSSTLGADTRCGGQLLASAAQVGTQYTGERRRNPIPSTPLDHLNQLPARVLIDRLPYPALAVDRSGAVIYANSAFAALLGYSDAADSVGRPLSGLLVGHACMSPQRSLAALRAAAGTEITWCHAEGHPVTTTVSSALLTRVTDPALLIVLTDTTAVQWERRR